MKNFYCGSSTIRKILLNGVLVLVYNSSIDKQENMMSKARQEVQELVDALHVEGAEFCGMQNSGDYVVGYLTGILKDLAESQQEVEKVIQSYLKMKR